MRSGDYSPDQYVERFPKDAHAPDAGVTPDELFRDWIAKERPTPSSIQNWRYVFHALDERFPLGHAPL